MAIPGGTADFYAQNLFILMSNDMATIESVAQETPQWERQGKPSPFGTPIDIIDDAETYLIDALRSDDSTMASTARRLDDLLHDAKNTYSEYVFKDFMLIRLTHTNVEGR